MVARISSKRALVFLNPCSRPTPNRLFATCALIWVVLFAQLMGICFSTFVGPNSITFGVFTLIVFAIPCYVTNPWNHAFSNNPSRRGGFLKIFIGCLVVLCLTAVIWGSVLMSKSAFREGIDEYCEQPFNCEDYDAAGLEGVLHTVVIIMLVLAVFFTIFLCREAASVGGMDLCEGCLDLVHEGEEEIESHLILALPMLCCCVLCFSLFFPFAVGIVLMPLGVMLAAPIYWLYMETADRNYCLSICFAVLAICVVCAPTTIAIYYMYTWMCEDTYATYNIIHPDVNTTEIIMITTGHDSLKQGWVDANCVATDILFIILEILSYIT